MPRGGRRRGTPGRGYANRSDLNANRALPATAAPSQQYGQRVAQERAQQVVPLAASPAPTVGPSAPRVGVAPQVVPLDAPPTQPLTFGAPFGAGPMAPPGLEAMSGGLDELRAIYQRYPDEELRRIIEDTERGG